MRKQKEMRMTKHAHFKSALAAGRDRGSFHDCILSTPCLMCSIDLRSQAVWLFAVLPVLIYTDGMGHGCLSCPLTSVSICSQAPDSLDSLAFASGPPPCCTYTSQFTESNQPRSNHAQTTLPLPMPPPREMELQHTLNFMCSHKIQDPS